MNKKLYEALMSSTSASDLGIATGRDWFAKQMSSKGGRLATLKFRNKLSSDDFEQIRDLDEAPLSVLINLAKIGFYVCLKSYIESIKDEQD